jgi:hypothetical protein
VSNGSDINEDQSPINAASLFYTSPTPASSDQNPSTGRGIFVMLKSSGRVASFIADYAENECAIN